MFRDASVDDADFIFKVRNDPTRNTYLSPTSPDLSDQVEWLRSYEKASGQAYFVILDDLERPVGTVRLYDAKRLSFCWGSWALISGVPSRFALESALMVYHYAWHLGFVGAHFQVKSANRSVCKFHERFGAVCTGDDGLSRSYAIDQTSITRAMSRHAKFLPSGIIISPPLSHLTKSP